GLLLLCDHASSALPPEYGDLGLPPAAFRRHIAYDIGAAGVTRRLAAALGAPAALTTFSRLLIDPNLGLDDPTLVMKLSDGAIVPGNAGADSVEIARRVERFWRPYRDAIGQETAAIEAKGVVPAILSIHSFTPAWKGAPRPWKAAILWDDDPRFNETLIAALRAEPDLGGSDDVGDNQPYDGAQEGDTIHEAATMRGFPSSLIEIRQDLIADDVGQAAWAGRLARILKPILADPALRAPRPITTRTKGRGRAFDTSHR
ncbi:MAG: N-formylglutamate amidohydrolase, partial [Hyphomicrobiales bacterium]|nr:N-formylglutamate amidohydrolase [Hyphomicrobiales bacterium]